MENVKKTSMNPIQQSASSRVWPARSDGFVRELCNRRKIHAPGKQPHQVKQPEIEAWDRVVIAGITQVQEAQQLLVDEEEPEEAVILARHALAW